MVLINLSLMPWDDTRKKRNQAIFTHLLADTDCCSGGFYVDPPLTLPHLAVWRAKPARERKQAASRTFQVIRPLYPLPFSYRPGVRDLLATATAAQLRRMAGGDYTLWINNVEEHSYRLALALLKDAACSVLDLSDDFASFTAGDPHTVRRQIGTLAARVDQVLGVNETVIANLPTERKMVFPNGTDFELFERITQPYVAPPLWPKPAGVRYIGFSGGLSRGKTDFGILEHLFREFPNDRFIFAGFADDATIVPWINAFPNASFVPSVPYDTLPAVIRSFDVAIIPHQINERTKGNDLLKVMDYFASGVPIVATPCSNLEQYGAAIDLATSPGMFAQAVRRALENRSAFDPHPGFAIARARSWKATVPALAQRIFPFCPSNPR